MFKEEIACCSDIGWDFFKQRCKAEACCWHWRMLNVAVELGDERILATALCTIGLYYEIIGVNGAYMALDEGEQIANRLQDREM